MGTRQLFCHRKEKVGISCPRPVVYAQLSCQKVRQRPIVSQSTHWMRTWSRKVERHLRNKIQDRSRDLVTRFRRSPLWILECIQNPTVPWCEAGPFQCLSPCRQLHPSEPNPRRAPSVQILLWCVAPAFPLHCYRSIFRTLSALSQNACNRLWMLPPLGGLNHPLSLLTEFGWVASSMANLIALRYGLTLRNKEHDVIHGCSPCKFVGQSTPSNSVKYALIAGVNPLGIWGCGRFAGCSSWSATSMGSSCDPLPTRSESVVGTNSPTLHPTKPMSTSSRLS